jgi:hypothetical protein
LFDDGPSQHRHVVEVLARSKPTSKEQQRFARLIARIELKREQLKRWQAYVLRYNQRVVGELEPLREKLYVNQRAMLILIDQLLDRTARAQNLGRMERTKLLQILLSLLSVLPDEADDEAVNALRAKYCDSSAQERQRPLDLSRNTLNDALDEVGEHHGAATEEDSLAQAAEGMRQSLRDVYRKLVSALHPDREPEPQARERKTGLMQRVNQAYEARDLFTLLGLQLEIEQINAGHLSSLAPQRLTHYNQLLSEQLASVDAELEQCLEPFRRSLGGAWGRRTLTVAGVDQDLSVHIAELRGVLSALQLDLAAFRDPRRLRESLRHFRLEQDFDEFCELAELMEGVQSRPPPRRSRR